MDLYQKFKNVPFYENYIFPLFIYDFFRFVRAKMIVHAFMIELD